MKKVLAFFALIFSVCLLLCACGGYENGKTFDKDFLKTLALQNMPLPQSESYALNNNIAGQQTLKFETDRNGFYSYVKSFVEYMQKRRDIYYFGLEVHEGQIAELQPHQVVTEIDNDFEPDSDSLTFAYSLSNEIEDSSRCEHMRYNEKISVMLDYDSEEGVAFISITKNGTFGSDCLDESLSSPYDMKLDYYGTYYRLAGVKADLSGEITLPTTYKGLPVKEIDTWGFSANDGVGGVNAVTKVIIPDCYEKIGFNAFDNMPNLKAVIIGNGVKEISSGAFEGCKELETVVFGNSVEAIYAEAFQYCEKLDNIVLPATLKEITYRAFCECRALRSIVIPKGVEEMGADVFYNNDSLTDIYCEIEAQPEGWDAKWCGNTREYCPNKNVNVTFGYGGSAPEVAYGVSFPSGYDYEPVEIAGLSYLYFAGSEVIFYLEPIDGVQSVAMLVNGVRHSLGEAIEMPKTDGTGNQALLKFTFTMPNNHTEITFQTEGGTN